jgi:hypothetical protein
MEQSKRGLGIRHAEGRLPSGKRVWARMRGRLIAQQGAGGPLARLGATFERFRTATSGRPEAGVWGESALVPVSEAYCGLQHLRVPWSCSAVLFRPSSVFRLWLALWLPSGISQR